MQRWSRLYLVPRLHLTANLAPCTTANLALRLHLTANLTLRFTGWLQALMVSARRRDIRICISKLFLSCMPLIDLVAYALLRR